MCWAYGGDHLIAPQEDSNHVHNCLNLSSCCGSKWCKTTYTFTFNDYICHAFQRVRQFLHNWTLFTTPLVNSFKELSISCQAFFPYSFTVLLLIIMGIQHPLSQHPYGTDIRDQQIIFCQRSPQNLQCFPLVFDYLGSMSFFLLQSCLQTWFSWKQHSTILFYETVLLWDIPTCLQTIVMVLFLSCRKLRLPTFSKVN